MREANLGIGSAHNYVNVGRPMIVGVDHDQVAFVSFGSRTLGDIINPVFSNADYHPSWET